MSFIAVGAAVDAWWCSYFNFVYENIIFGAMVDDSAPDTCTITVIATGLDEKNVNISASSLINQLNRSQKVQTPTRPVQQPVSSGIDLSLIGGDTQTPSYTAPQVQTINTDFFASEPKQPEAPEYEAPAAPSFDSSELRSRANKAVQINIPDFLKNKR